MRPVFTKLGYSLKLRTLRYAHTTNYHYPITTSVSTHMLIKRATAACPCRLVHITTPQLLNMRVHTHTQLVLWGLVISDVYRYIFTSFSAVTLALWTSFTWHSVRFTLLPRTSLTTPPEQKNVRLPLIDQTNMAASGKKDGALTRILRRRPSASCLNCSNSDILTSVAIAGWV